MKRAALILFGAISLLSLSPTNGFACTCDLPPINKTEQQLIVLERKKSAAVFTGEVVEIVVEKTGAGEVSSVSQVKFKAQRTWKGKISKQVSVFTTNVCCVCGYEFKLGESYLVYAWGSDKLTTNACTRTKRLADAETDLKTLGGGKIPKNGKASKN